MVDSEAAVQIAVNNLETVTSKYGLKISKSNAKAMSFKERDPVGSKIVINSHVVEDINNFSHLRCSVSYQNEIDIPGKISKFLQITGSINRTSKPSQVQIHTTLTICNTLALPTLLCGCEIWGIEELDNFSEN
jgi:hypothetical protein